MKKLILTRVCSSVRNSVTFSGLQLQQRCSVHMSSIYRPVNVMPPGPPGKAKGGKKGDEQLSKSLRVNSCLIEIVAEKS